MPKKKSRRSTTENAATNPQLNLKSRYEELEDINEYFHTLSPKDKKWMNDYTENFVNASFDKDPDENLISLEFTKTLLKKYIKDLKGDNAKDKKVISFVNKYLIRADNVPLKIIKELFFEKNEKKQLRLIGKLREEIFSNIKDTKKREINKIIKIMEKEVYGINNSRNRCILTREKAGGSLNYIEELSENDQYTNTEDDLIDIIDLKNSLNKLNNTNNNGNDSSNDT